jgi:hypothetical protein
MAKEEPRVDKDCGTAIQEAQSARTVTVMVLRKLDGDHIPGVYEVQDAAGQVAQLMTAETTFTTTGWTTITVSEYGGSLIELSGARRAKAQQCLSDQQKLATARAEFASSSKQLDARIGSLSREFVASCATANNDGDGGASLDPGSSDRGASGAAGPISDAGSADLSTTQAPEPAPVIADAIKALMGAQVSSLPTAGSGFLTRSTTVRPRGSLTRSTWPRDARASPRTRELRGVR